MATVPNAEILKTSETKIKNVEIDIPRVDGTNEKNTINEKEIVQKNNIMIDGNDETNFYSKILNKMKEFWSLHKKWIIISIIALIILIIIIIVGIYFDKNKKSSSSSDTTKNKLEDKTSKQDLLKNYDVDTEIKKIITTQNKNLNKEE